MDEIYNRLRNDIIRHEADRQVSDYLSRNYYIRSDRFYCKFRKRHIFGNQIIRELIIIFSCPFWYAEVRLENWVMSKGHDIREMLMQRRTLLTCINTELVAYFFGHSDFMKDLIEILTNEISLEIDAGFINFSNPSNFNELVVDIRSLGFELQDVVYDADFIPRRYFIAINYDEIKEARANNPKWQSWIMRS